MTPQQLNNDERDYTRKHFAGCATCKGTGTYLEGNASGMNDRFCTCPAGEAARVAYIEKKAVELKQQMEALTK